MSTATTRSMGMGFARVVFIEGGVNAGAGAPKQAWSHRTRRKEPAVGQRDDRRPRRPVAAETELDRHRGRAERLDGVAIADPVGADRVEQRIAVVSDHGGPDA